MAAVTRRLTLALVVVLAVLAPLASGAQAAPDTTLTAAGQEGLQQVATCLRSNPNLVALMMIDESGSLGDTDPQNKRAAVLADFVAALSGLAGQETAKGPRTVQFAADTFSMDARPLLPWTTLTAENAKAISDQMRSQIPDLNKGGPTGDGTNYEAAMKRARSSIAQGVSKVDSETTPCKLVVWFTDGLLNVSNDDAEDAASAARLCEPDGPVNSLRKDGLHLISVLLWDPKLQGAGAAKDAGTALLQSTAEGTGGSGKYATTCGKQPIPADYARGAYFEGNVDALAGLFGQAIALGSGGTPVPGLTGTPVTFTIEPGFTQFWVTAQAPGGFTLTSPAGDSLAGQPGSQGGTIAGTSAVAAWTGSTVTVKVPVTSQGAGAWTLARPGMADGVGVYLFSSYSLKVNPSELVADEQATIAGQVIDTAGKPVDLSGLSSAKLSVTQVVDGKQVEPVPFTLDAKTGTFSGTFTPQTTSTEVRFDLTLDLVTKSGFALAPLTTSFTQQVKLPGAYAQLSPTTLSLGSLQNRGDTAAGTLQVTGSPDGPTTVCVRAVTVESTVPEAGVTVGSNPASGCVSVDKGGAASIDVTAALANAVQEGGQVSGRVELSVTNAPTAQLPQTRERSVTVPFSAQVVPVAPLLWVPIVLFVAGLLIPLLILVLLNWWAARLRLGGMMMARVPVALSLQAGGALTRVDGKSPVLTHDDLAFTPVPDRARSWQPGAETLRGHAPLLNPFGSVTARVIAPDGSVVISDRAPTNKDHGLWAGIDLCPSMSAYVLINRQELADAIPGELVAGELVAYLIPEELERDARHLAEDVSIFGAWGDVALQLKSEGVTSGPSAPENPDVLVSTVVAADVPDGPARRSFDLGGGGAPTGGSPPAPPSGRSGGNSPEPPPSSPSSGNRFSL